MCNFSSSIKYLIVPHSYLKNLNLKPFEFQVIQRRDDYGDPRENFNRDWDDYKYGFGKPDQELWLGNENIFLLTKASEYEMRVDLEDFDGNKR